MRGSSFFPVSAEKARKKLETCVHQWTGGRLIYAVQPRARRCQTHERGRKKKRHTNKSFSTRVFASRHFRREWRKWSSSTAEGTVFISRINKQYFHCLVLQIQKRRPGLCFPTMLLCKHERCPPTDQFRWRKMMLSLRRLPEVQL